MERSGIRTLMDIVIANVGPDTTTADVARLLHGYPSASDVRLVASPVGQDRRLAYVAFADAGEAAQAIEALDGTEFGGRPIRVRIAEARDADRLLSQSAGSLPAAMEPRATSSLTAFAEAPKRAHSGWSRPGSVVIWFPQMTGRLMLYLVGTVVLIMGFAWEFVARRLTAGGRRAIRRSQWRHPLVRREETEAKGRGSPPDALSRTDANPLAPD